MQIVIDIPDAQYEIILRSDETWAASCASKEVMMYAIKTGTPLPKGHGRLKDVDAIIDTLGCSDGDIYVKACIEEDAPTIIEADKGSEAQHDQKRRERSGDSYISERE